MSTVLQDSPQLEQDSKWDSQSERLGLEKQVEVSQSTATHFGQRGGNPKMARLDVDLGTRGSLVELVAIGYLLSLFQLRT